jgi:hypothetical protein
MGDFNGDRKTDILWGLKPPVPSSGIHIEFEQPVASAPPPKPSLTRTKISSDGSLISVSQDPLAGVPDKMWNPGQTLRVRMTGGTAIVRSKVRQFAEQWTKYANIRLQFVDDSSPAEIKISFDQGQGTWSSVGRDALGVPFNYSTMNFDDLSDSSSDWEYGKYVLHEFGHALGLIHEHQSPAAGIAWDKEKVYKYFKESQIPPWDQAKVDQNIFDRFSAATTNYSQYDPTSIMHYAYSADLLLSGPGVAPNSSLSAIDKQYIGMWYPFPNADVGQLRTGDDCDEINFNVQYGVESPDTVRFKLSPGAIVTGWKLIEIPIEGDKYQPLQINATGLDPALPSDQVLDKAKLDSSRPIRFNKAKFLGFHTLLDYRWDVIQALPGGSRVDMQWVKDTCR